MYIAKKSLCATTSSKLLEQMTQRVFEINLICNLMKKIRVYFKQMIIKLFLQYYLYMVV